MAGQDPAALHVVGLEVLTGQRQRSLDHHVVEGHEVDLGGDVRRIRQQRLVRLDQIAVEQLEVVGRQVLASPLQPVLEAAVVLEHLLVEAVEKLRVARPRHPLGGQERPPLLFLPGPPQPPEHAPHPPPPPPTDPPAPHHPPPPPPPTA